MENRFLNNFKSIVVLNIKSKNIDRVLRKIYDLNICIFNVECISRKEANIKIFQKDYKKIEEIRLINEINIVEKLGSLKIKNTFKNNKILIIMLVVGYIFLYVLSNVIFSIDIVHSDSKLRSYIKEVLKENGIKTFTLKKSYEEINRIKEKILEENKDKIEWIEIDRIGTKYIIKLEERRTTPPIKEYKYQDIISSKAAIIKKIEAENGIIVKKVNDYVQKGDVIISGSIMQNDASTKVIKASGRIYGEVWYNIKVEFPLLLDKKEETGNSKSVYAINFLNYSIPIFDFKPYKNKTIVNDVLLYDKLLPINISLQKQYELSVISGIYSSGEALIEAEKYATNKMKSTLSSDEYIIKNKVLNYEVQNEKIMLEMFYAVYENITDTREIIAE